jgi:predicted ArsR family transcriptional regulator
VDEASADLAAVCSLDDRTRFALYRHVATARQPVTRDDAASAAGVDRSVAAYHLDRLVEQGLLVTSFARPEGRSGPGAGRPSKRYQRSGAEINVTLPPRSYEMLAELLATAVESDEDGAVRAALHRAAAAIGTTMARPGEGLKTVLQRQGFEPFADEGTLRLGNCPFHHLARRHTELVCTMNLAMLGAAAAAVEDGVARLDPAEGRCCVAFDRVDA